MFTGRAVASAVGRMIAIGNQLTFEQNCSCAFQFVFQVHWHSMSRRIFTGRAVASDVGRMIAIGN
jgi:diadenosine tetraphosphate (Ap4A) HIT family hydrolase